MPGLSSPAPPPPVDLPLTIDSRLVPRPAHLAGYSTAEVARLLDLSGDRVRAWVRAGFLSPARTDGGRYRFSFQDLVVLRTAQALAEAEVPTRRVRRALQRLVGDLPAGRSLAAIRISAEGGHVVVRQGSESWNPESGQRLLNFEVAELAHRAAPLALRAVDRAQRTEGLDADDWYEIGYELEATAPEEAERAYVEALAIEPEHADAHLNLGRLLHERGNTERAEEHYRKALAARPRDATAAFDLGVALQDLGRIGAAMEAYRLAVEIDPDCADAYFNLAVLYEDLGEKAAAIRSLKAYRSLRQS